ncbi:MAG TPA: 2-dehydropantoate 2-reductase [Candidatus Elarobacter sp.]|nr:2-dehydropantoate 2-reductase [Candidatus Elarobacter sp.]
MKIGIVGAGAIGLTFAAALARTNEVVVLARRPELAELLARDGITIERADRNANAKSNEKANENSDTGEIERVRVEASGDPRALADRDALIVAVKAYATADALAPLRAVLPPHTLVASVQNGLGNVEAARTALPEARIVAGSTTQGAIRIADGRVRPMNSGTTLFARAPSGTPIGPGAAVGRTSAPTSDDLAAAFVAAGLDARVVDDVDAILWRKLVVNAAINPACALAARPNGAVVDDPDLEALARALAAEASAVARAEGVAIDRPWEAVAEAARASAANRNSMLQDLEAGRPTEIEAISGEIARRAATRGIAVPVTETVLRLVRGRERSTAEHRSKGPS